MIRLIVKGTNQSIKVIHRCPRDKIINISQNDTEISREEFYYNFINEEAKKIHLYRNEIFQPLFLRFRQKYESISYPIPPKNKVSRIIREQ